MFEKQFTKIFVKVDDFCRSFSHHIDRVRKLSTSQDKPRRHRASALSDSEIIAIDILIEFHRRASISGQNE